VDIAELARPLAETANIEVLVEQQTEGVSIGVDLDLLKQAMLNVVINAIEAMPQGGKLRFESAVRGDDAEIRVTDTGCGIAPELESSEPLSIPQTQVELPQPQAIDPEALPTPPVYTPAETAAQHAVHHPPKRQVAGQPNAPMTKPEQADPPPPEPAPAQVAET